jgi:hypothetical protein
VRVARAGQQATVGPHSSPQTPPSARRPSHRRGNHITSGAGINVGDEWDRVILSPCLGVIRWKSICEMLPRLQAVCFLSGQGGAVYRRLRRGRKIIDSRGTVFRHSTPCKGTHRHRRGGVDRRVAARDRWHETAAPSPLEPPQRDSERVPTVSVAGQRFSAESLRPVRGQRGATTCFRRSEHIGIP